MVDNLIHKFNLNMINVDALYLGSSKPLSIGVSESEIAEDDWKTLQNIIKGSKVEDIVAKFPIKVLPNIIKEPYCGTINNMVKIFTVTRQPSQQHLGGGGAPQTHQDRCETRVICHLFPYPLHRAKRPRGDTSYPGGKYINKTRANYI